MPESRLKIWLMAIRPKTLWAAAGPVLIGTVMAYGDERFHPVSALCALLGAVMIQVGTNLANDYFDFKKGADSGERLGPVRITQAGLASPRAVALAFTLAFSIAFIFGLYLVWRGGLPILIVGLLSILFGILYTAGPFPLGYHGFGDLFVLIFFGPVAVGGTYYVQALDLNYIVLAAGLSPGLLSVAILAVNNLRDIETDAKAGKRTLAVRFGKKFAKLEYAGAIFGACLIPSLISITTASHYYLSVCILVLIAAFPKIKIVFRGADGQKMNAILADTGKLLLIFSLCFSAGWLL